MQIQLNTDKHVQGDDALAEWTERELKDKLARFRDQITRVEVHLSDVNGARVGDADKRCKLEARLAGRQPVTVSHDAGKVADALQGAAAKLVRALDTALGRVRDVRGRDSIRGESGD
ncbi:MAG: HPF/RaiA family ribosome-associated protein [Rubrivivax sp.]|nr:HPF/RaiA family ribosome-associated protein [Rubrivivax sp.]